MSMLAWNCRGLGNPPTIRLIKNIGHQKRPSIIFLSETPVKKKQVKKLCRVINFSEYIAVDGQGHSGGLAFLWKNKNGSKVNKATRNFTDFEVKNEQVGRWRYTGFYGCSERHKRHESWDMLRGLAKESGLPCCVVRDFNEMLYENEKRGGRKQPYNLLVGFMETLNECGLQDLGYVGEKYTWEKSRGETNWIQKRLDRV